MPRLTSKIANRAGKVLERGVLAVGPSKAMKRRADAIALKNKTNPKAVLKSRYKKYHEKTIDRKYERVMNRLESLGLTKKQADIISNVMLFRSPKTNIKGLIGSPSTKRTILKLPSRVINSREEAISLLGNRISKKTKLAINESLRTGKPIDKSKFSGKEILDLKATANKFLLAEQKTLDRYRTEKKASKK